ncbi:MAG: hypothetical protein IN808_04305 [Rubrobacter sp.]|jgi:Cu/Zn superoxide dismutase|nr:hypothetical protein [Rubrobacter sp.]
MAMMHKGLIAGVAALLLVFASVGRAEGEEVEVRLSPSRDSGVSGVARLADVEGGVRVELSVHGLPEAGVEHINHIHGGGTCADDRAGRTAPVTIPLEPVRAREDGTGSATTLVEGTSTQKLFDGSRERFILLHARVEEGGGVPPGISCADLVRVSSGVLPDSGGAGFRVPALLLAGALAASLTLAALLRRR